MPHRRRTRPAAPPRAAKPFELLFTAEVSILALRRPGRKRKRLLSICVSNGRESSTRPELHAALRSHVDGPDNTTREQQWDDQPVRDNQANRSTLPDERASAFIAATVPRP